MQRSETEGLAVQHLACGWIKRREQRQVSVSGIRSQCDANSSRRINIHNLVGRVAVENKVTGQGKELGLAEARLQSCEKENKCCVEKSNPSHGGRIIATG